jgi:hypothetical protein
MLFVNCKNLLELYIAESIKSIKLYLGKRS